MLRLIVLAAMIVLVNHAYARDDGRYADSNLKSWFDALRSGHGLCCSVADGRTVADPDWGTENGHYWVRIDGKKIAVPDDAVVDVPNRFGQAVAWPIGGEGGLVLIRCFMPGGGT